MPLAYPGHAEPSAESGPSLIIFDSQLQLRFTNHGAESLIEQARALGCRPPTEPQVALEIVTLAARIKDLFDEDTSGVIWDTFELTHRYMTSAGPLSLRAFGIFFGRHLSDFRIFVLIDRTPSPTRTPEATP